MNASPHPGWQERTIQLIGETGCKKLASARVLVAGLGGVGAMAAEMLCRAGVGHLTIADGDTIQPGNLNRQLPAKHSTIGRKKADVTGETLMDINPGLDMVIINSYIRDDGMEDILSGHFDYVVDAIDTLSPKTSLIYHAMKRGLKLVSSMGSGGKTDPSLIRIADISESFNCRLAYLLRKKLRKLGIERGFKVVFSTEPVDKKVIIPVEDELNKKSTAGTISYIPAMFGCMMASAVVRDLVDGC
ncbi:MAG: tRNA threonylcarbamoyladenosine dehydratase [Bacteroidales bacterium]|nr:tRNA threonylcarbamoyladenosine dehydratase [Bacteroidales bacterium]MBN2698811.1 tRNA threonylcarbamoyladenosine dehydratase [Bacteroidales bacterium]